MVKQYEMLKFYYRSTPTASAVFALGANANPRDFSVNRMASCFPPCATYPNDGIVPIVANPPHAIVDSKTAKLIGVANMGSFVDQYAHVGILMMPNVELRGCALLRSPV